ncbi:DUF4401 domain-containing protein [Psychrobacter sp. 72-O-c]|uniref:DUF4401 domain-containing protein n=1 Tax=Psychrobacter sp. 72-O-c TaxID=2774125 RepID=UPI00191903F8|nr:DUF4401 domain-containing protein [Psychrobacter sp. 72-O-c]
MNNQHQQSIAKLQQLGLLTTVTSENKAGNDLHDDNSPWFIQLLFGFSGVLASLFFVGFLSLILFETSVFDSVLALFIIGLLLSAVGFALFRSSLTRKSAFLSSVAFAVIFAGQLYLAFALFGGELGNPLDIWLFLLLQAFMTLIVPNRIYRWLSAIVTLGFMVYLLNYYHITEVSLGLLALITVVTNLQRYELLQRVPMRWQASSSNILSAVAYASAVMLLAVSVYFIAAEYGNDFVDNSFDNGADFVYNYFLAQGLLILASLYGAYLILKRYQVKIQSTLGLIIVCAVAVLGVVSIYVSGLLATSLIIIIATANSQRVLLALGIIALVSYIFWYYYQLDSTLLIKSISMLVIGLTILLMRWLLVERYAFESTKQVNIDEQKEHLL